MNRIQELRKEAKLSQTELATAAGWSQVRWSNYERDGTVSGGRTPNVRDAIKIVEAFGRLGVATTLDYLFPVAAIVEPGEIATESTGD